MLTHQELLRLQKLSALTLSDEERSLFVPQLSQLISFLSRLQTRSDSSQSSGSLDFRSSSLCLGVSSYQDVDGLFVNTLHQKIGNSPVISSVIDTF